MRYLSYFTLIMLCSPLLSNDEFETSSGIIDLGATIDLANIITPTRTSNLSNKIILYKPIPTNLPTPTKSGAIEESSYQNLDESIELDGNRQYFNTYQADHDLAQDHPTMVQGVIDNETVIPPDTQGAVGPNHLVITLNDNITIQNKTGTTLRTISLNNFWAPLGGNPNAFDPRIAYDPYNSRWIFTSSSNDTSTTSAILIAVSATSDPTGTWFLYRIKADTSSLVWADQPTMGFNQNWITIQANMFNVSNSNFNGSHIYVINKANLYAHGSIAYTLFSNTSIGASQIPAQTYDNTITTQYLLQDWNGNSGGNGYLRLYQITGTVNSPTLSVIGLISAPAPWGSTSPIIHKGFAPQAQTSLRIMTDDSRIINVVYRNGSLWAAQNVFLPANSPTRCSAQWWQISTIGTVQQRGRIDTPTATATNGGFFYAYPSIAVNSRSDVLIGYSRFGSTTFASAGFSYRLAADTANTLRASHIFQAGRATYTKDFNSGEIRWGDYSNSVVDPINDHDFWTIQEYAETHFGSTSRWAVAWGHLVLS